jgi:hypothetical protein
MFNRGVQKKQKDDNVSSIRPAKSPPVGRDRLHFFVAELAKANEAVVDLEKRVATLEDIGIDAIAADRALQHFIAQPGGTEALLAHSAGHSEPDDLIAKLIGQAKTTAEAAGPAKSALPLAIDALEKSKAEVIRLGEEKNAEVGRYMVQLGDDLARKYKAAFAAVCIAHDRLAGFAAGAGLYEVRMLIDPITAPRFDLPSLTVGQTEFDPLMRHTGSQLTIGESSKTWASVRSRLEADVDADISDLLT